MNNFICSIWNSENGEFTDKALKVQYWACLLFGIFSLIICSIIR